MDLNTVQLAPFTFTPPDQPGEPSTHVSFRLKPLTEPQVVDLYAYYDDYKGLRIPMTRAFYQAGCMAIEGGGEIRNLTIDGKPANWLLHKDFIPHGLVHACGMRVLQDAHGRVGDDLEGPEKN
jgi:hypothetical protein